MPTLSSRKHLSYHLHPSRLQQTHSTHLVPSLRRAEVQRRPPHINSAVHLSPDQFCNISRVTPSPPMKSPHKRSWERFPTCSCISSQSAEVQTAQICNSYGCRSVSAPKTAPQRPPETQRPDRPFQHVIGNSYDMSSRPGSEFQTNNPSGSKENCVSSCLPLPC